MFSTDDTIVAIATPEGRGGIGLVRLSGPESPAIAGALLDRRAPLEARRATFARVRTGNGPIDEVVATWFPAPASYTGEHVVEISAHGSPVVLRTIVGQAIEAGARLAEPGEFTLRSFLNGKRDLVQAEAVADLIAAVTPLQARVACDQLDGTLTRRIGAIEARLFDLIARLEASLDFPDEGYHFVEAAAAAADAHALVEAVDALLADAARGRMIREGATVVIAGRPNVGKSTLFNALAGGDRAIVTDVPGTTRDLLTERIDIEGVPLTVVDTAGSRDAVDLVEREGVVRAAQAREAADLVLVVLDASEPLTPDDRCLLERTSKHRRILVASKSDRPAAWLPGGIDSGGEAGPAGVTPVSAKTGAGLDELRRAIVQALAGGEPQRDTAAVSNVRHVHLLTEARAHLAQAHAAAAAQALPEEFVLAELQAARGRLEEIVGTRTNDDLLRHIFERFCIGK